VAKKAARASPPARRAAPNVEAPRPKRVEEGRRLTLKQEAFVRAYLETGNASEAYRKAYNVGGMSAANITTEAARLLQNPTIAPMVEAGREQLAAHHGVTAEMVIRELKRIATADIRKIVEWTGKEVREESKSGKITVRAANDVILKASSEIDDDTAAAISEIVLTKDGLRVKLWPKDAALTTLARHLGLMDDTREPGNITVQIVNFSTMPQPAPELARKEAPTLERMRTQQRGRGNG
jgi:phage terminase small subunit